MPVVLFHAGFNLFRGGFIGVDVFFVISGYLITSILITELNENTFSLVKFYERRARRILPALFLVLLCCLPFAWLWLLPAAEKGFSQSLIAVTGFASNILFWQTSGYFQSAAAQMPLLHTWSLAVEEQYYLLFPIFLMLTWRLGRRWTLALIFAAAIASLAVAQWAAVNKPDAAFYLLPTRGWELLMGAVLAFCRPARLASNRDRIIAQLVSFAGFLFISWAIFAFNKGTPFPSLYTLLPTVGASLIILFASDQTFVGKLLGSKAFVGIGLVSYSAYLWHQPLFAFAKYHSAYAPSHLLLGGLALATFALAYLSWRYVETPFRDKKRFSRRDIWLFSAAGSALLAVAGSVGYLTNGFARLKLTGAQVAVLGTAAPSPRRRDCHTGGTNYLRPKDSCEYQSGTLNWAVFGDSHAVELAYALAEKLSVTNNKLKHFSFSGCNPSYGAVTVAMPECSAWTKEAVDYISNNTQIQYVAVSYRINAHLFGGHEGLFPELPNDLTDSERDGIWASYVNILRRFVASGKKVMLVLQAPELRKPIDTLVIRAPNPSGDVVGVERRWWNERTKYVQARLHEIPHEVTIVDPANDFCNEVNCFAARRGIAYYFDDNHMSVAGARIVADDVFRTLGY